MMTYSSTRGDSARSSFLEAAMGGLAPDGGLYMPEVWPRLDLDRLAGLPYWEVAAEVLFAFSGEDVPLSVWRTLTANAYEKFAHHSVAPLVDLDDGTKVLELFHGPTLAFKDFALYLIGQLFDWQLQRLGRRLCAIVATSGDTGGAAAGALANLKSVDLVVLYPAGRISEVQRRFITSTGASNVHALELSGVFDDCQSIVKSMLNDQAFAARHRLAAVNSINFARIAAQTVYYVTTALALGRPFDVVVPSGNLGDAFAGYAAQRMGVPVERITIATNANDILARAMAQGVYANGEVRATISPAMDIQVASNFERALYEAVGRDGNAVRQCYAQFAQAQRFEIPSYALANLRRVFASGAATDDEARAEIRRVHAAHNMLICPHTAVGLAVARKLGQRGTEEHPLVCLATAHAAKFPDTVIECTGISPDIPPHAQSVFERREEVVRLPAEEGAVRDVIARLSTTA